MIIKVNKLSNSITEQAKVSISAAEGELSERIRNFKNIHANKGTSNSGRYVQGLKELLLEHVNNIYDIFWEQLYLNVKSNPAILTSEKIKLIIKNASRTSVGQAESELMLEIRKTEPYTKDAERLFEQMKFASLADSNLNRRVKEYQENLLPLEANVYSKSSRNIAIWSLVVASLALLISLYK